MTKSGPEATGTNGYLTTGVVPVGAGPGTAQQAGLSLRYPVAAFTDAVDDAYNAPAATFDPKTGLWLNPQDAETMVPFPNTLALAYAPPGSAAIAGVPGRPVPLGGLIDGTAPSVAGG